MKILGMEISFRRKAVPAVLASPVSSDRGWYPLIREPFTGAWQQGVTVERSNVMADSTVFRCLTLIASDIAKLRIKLVAQDSSGLWAETSNPAFSPVLRKPNHYQTRIQFIENWIISKLSHGNAYLLKERDGRGVVSAIYPLDPSRVKPLVSDHGSVFYDLRADNLSGVEQNVIVPASEIIHDRFNCLYHPLVGVSPIFAAGLAATQSQAIRNNSATFFANQSLPSGLLVAPGNISDENAERLKSGWQDNFSGSNRGKIAVLGDGLKYEPMAMAAEAAQLVEQMGMSRSDVCAAFGIPPFKVGGELPNVGNAALLEQTYYQQTLQILIESLELCLDEGLGLGTSLGTELDLDGLLRLDNATLVTSLKDAVGAGIMAPNEARRKLDLPPVKGGESPLAQQQNYSLEALAKRDAKDDPFSAAPAPAAKTIDRVANLSTRSIRTDEEVQKEIDDALAAGWRPTFRVPAGRNGDQKAIPAISDKLPIRDYIREAIKAGITVSFRKPAGSKEALA